MTTPYCPTCGKPNDTGAVEIEVVLDRSGSMQSIKKDAIGGFNTWLAEQQKVPGAANLVLTLFDNEFITSPATPLSLVQPLTEQTYIPRGSTALNDAIGMALNRLETKNPERAILVILTDGGENASKRFTAQQIRQRIEVAQGRGWQVLYLSAALSAFTDAASFGIMRSATTQFSHDSHGTRSAYVTMSTANTNYRNGEPAIMPAAGEATTKSDA